jgi:hypothetical protein
MAEYSAPASQTINPGESFVFTSSPVPCNRGFVRWRAGTGNFNLSGWVPNRYGPCNCQRIAQYLVDFGANVSLPDGATAEQISVAFALDGGTLIETTMQAPGEAGTFYNISKATIVPIWRGCCQTLTVRNTSAVPIVAQNANIIFARPDLQVTY